MARGKYQPPLARPQARQQYAREVVARHRAGPRRWWQWRSRCGDEGCGRRWPCPKAEWAREELVVRWWRG